MEKTFKPDVFASTVINVVSNCMPYQGYTITDARIVENDVYMPFPYVLLHAMFYPHDMYIDAIVPLKQDFTDLEAISAIAGFMDEGMVWKVSPNQCEESPETYQIQAFES